VPPSSTAQGASLGHPSAATPGQARGGPAIGGLDSEAAPWLVAHGDDGCLVLTGSARGGVGSGGRSEVDQGNIVRARKRMTRWRDRVQVDAFRA
jgi:hypothetical protein